MKIKKNKEIKLRIFTIVIQIAFHCRKKYQRKKIVINEKHVGQADRNISFMAKHPFLKDAKMSHEFEKLVRVQGKNNQTSKLVESTTRDWNVIKNLKDNFWNQNRIFN